MGESLLFGAKMSTIRVWVLVILVLDHAGLPVASDQGCRVSCGGKPVPYPFGVDDGCGDRDFKDLLSCEDEWLVLKTGSRSYNVSIDPDGHTVSINDTTLLSCSTLEGPVADTFTPPDNRLAMTTRFIAFSNLTGNDGLAGREWLGMDCQESGQVHCSTVSCPGGPNENHWNVTFSRGSGGQSGNGSLLIFSLCPALSNPRLPSSFCITNNPPDGSLGLSYSSIVFADGEDGSPFTCSPTIEYKYVETTISEACVACQKASNVCGYDDKSFVCRRQFLGQIPTESPPSSAKKLGPVLGGVAAGGAGLAAFILCFLFGCRRLKSWRSRRSHGKQMRNIAIILDAGSGSSSDRTSFSYKELATATKNFAPERRIGGGGFSVVYRGKLKDGRQVAVKRLHQVNLQGRQQFMAELTVLSQARHPNLVLLYGSCPEQSILVYEYVANGTLAEHLHGSRSVPFLNCRTRLSIAVEVAEALAYLHSLHPPIVHRDVKSSNILLDEGCRAKVGDFGLSRLHDVDRTHVSTAPQGTPGYLDPDYHQTYHLSDKSDVYSLGVVLMELVSGKKAVDMSRERGEINLSAMAAARIQSGAMEELLEPGLTSSAGDKDAAMALAELGFQCLATEKDDRPSMQEVVSKIKSIQYMAFAFPSPTPSPLRAQESSRLIKYKSEDWVPSESYPGLDVELQGR